MSEICKVALRAPVAVGMNAIWYVQKLPGATVKSQPLEKITKSPAFGPVIESPVIVTFALPVL